VSGWLSGTLTSPLFPVLSPLFFFPPYPETYSLPRLYFLLTKQKNARAQSPITSFSRRNQLRGMSGGGRWCTRGVCLFARSVHSAVAPDLP